MSISPASHIVVALVLAASAPALAQSGPAADSGMAPPVREGNVYDHKAHQPTQSDARAAEGAVSTVPSAESKRQVEEEVRQLLQQTDRLDNQSEQHERLTPDPQ